MDWTTGGVEEDQTIGRMRTEPLAVHSAAGGDCIQKKFEWLALFAQQQVVYCLYWSKSIYKLNIDSSGAYNSNNWVRTSLQDRQD